MMKGAISRLQPPSYLHKNAHDLLYLLMIFIFTANIWSSCPILEMKMEDFCLIVTFLLYYMLNMHVKWSRHYQNNCDPTVLMCTKTKPTSCWWPSHSFKRLLQRPIYCQSEKLTSQV